MKTISQELKRYRNNLNMNMVELATKAGISIGFLNDIDKGRTLPSYKTLEKLMIALLLSESQKQELLEIAKNERFNRSIKQENKKFSEMSHDEREKILDEYRADLPGIPIEYVDKPSPEVAAMGEAEVNKGLGNVTIAFNAFNKLTLEEKKILLTLFNDSLKGK